MPKCLILSLHDVLTWEYLQALMPGLTSRTSLRPKVRRIVRALEKALGVPEQSAVLPPPLDMLVATILSQNTNDKNSHRAYVSLRERYRTWELTATAPLRNLKSAIRVGGMANQKGVRIRKILKQINNRYGKFDLSALKAKSSDEIIAELTALDGVGPKTAACVLLFSLGRDVFPVDTHVHRICTRLGFVPHSGSPEKTFEAMRPLVPKGKGYSFHTNLIRFGRRICRSNNPVCSICPVFSDCVYPDKGKTKAGRRESSADHDFMLLDNVRA